MLTATKNISFTDFLEEQIPILEEEEKHRSDILLPLKTMEMLKNGHLQTPDGKELSLREHGLVQFCQELNMPAKFIKKVMGIRSDMVADLSNLFLNLETDENERRLRLFDNGVQGIVSKSYVPYDDLQLFHQLYELRNRFPYGEVTSYYRDDKRTHIKVRFPEVTKNVGISEEDGKTDVLMGGISIGNSQVGYGILKVDPLVWRQICKNGMMGWGESENGLKQRHIHFDPLTIGEQLEKGVLVAVDNTKILMSQMEQAREIRITNPMVEIEKYAKRVNLRKKQIEEIQKAYHFEPQANLYGVINAFTRYARDLKSDEAKAELETFAGSLLRQVA